VDSEQLMAYTERLEDSILKMVRIYEKATGCVVHSIDLLEGKGGTEVVSVGAWL